jgi:hypothetical protein
MLYLWDSFEQMFEKTSDFVKAWGTEADPRRELHQ